jgi:signal transduction histidine kinase
MFRSATFKLTVWYMIIIVFITLTFSFVVYRLAVNELANGLAHQSARFLDEFPAFSSNLLSRERSELASGRQQIIGNLVVFNIAVLVTAGFGSYALARRTLQPIETAHEQQKRFTADVSHELRTPLTAIHMETEVALMDKKAGKSQLREALMSNLEETTKLEQLINNLMRLSKLEATELQQTFTRQKLEEVVKDAIAGIKPLSARRKVKVTSGTIPGTVMGDHASLVQLLTVLIENAIKYSPAGSEVHLTGSRHGDEMTVSIHDQGIGIEPKALEHIFERFYRADKARASGDTPGFGLGLSIAKQIADTHNGTITLKSRSGHGTTAVIKLPAA